MRIINAIFSQNIGGVNQVFKDYANVLTDMGHEVSLLISDNGFDDYGDFKIFKLANKSQIFDVIRLFFIILRFRPDLIICHSNRTMSWLKILRPFIKTKSVALNHGISFKKSLLCDYIININQEINDMVVAAGFDKNKSFVINNAINVNCDYLAKDISEFKIGIYGRYERRKGFDILFKAAKILKEQQINIKYKIGGFSTVESWKEDDIKDFANEANVGDDCEFYGVVKDKKDFFEDVNLFIVPSIEEPFGLVLLEGFLHSTLVISSNTDGGKLIIDHQKNGLLFENGNALDLANKIKYIIANNEKYHSLTAKAYDDLKKRFSYARLGKDLENILSKLK